MPFYNDVSAFTSFLSSHHLAATFIGAFFLGESAILTAAYLSPTLGWSILSLAAIMLLATLLSDSLWFALGRRLPWVFARVTFFESKREQTASLLARLTGNRPFLALLFTKFIYGTRIATIFYLALRGISFPTFLFFDFLGALLWLVVLVPLGYSAGKQLSDDLPFLDTLTLAIIVFVLSFVLFRIFARICMATLVEKKE